LSEKHGAKFSSTSLGYPLVRICSLNDVFLRILDLEASPVERVSNCSKTIRKGKKGKAKKIIIINKKPNNL